MELNLNELREFILSASRATYASGDESLKVAQSDKSTTIEYRNGSYHFHDNYFGGEPYGGREVVFKDGKPIWMMVYYGHVVEGLETKGVYAFLMESLSHSTLEMPYRGPELYEKDSLRYENNLQGSIERFSGTERIFKDNVLIYEASYLGGLVDK